MDSIEARAYKLFEATFRAKAKNKLQDSNRGIWKGKLLESLNIEVAENGDDVTLNIYAESYMEFIDQGINGAGFNQTKSNRPDKRFKSNRSVVTGAPYSYKDKKPPLSAIKPWALSKGLNPYAVQTSIYRKGIKGIHFFESTIDEEFSKMLDYITEIKADSLLNDFGDD